MKNTNIYIYIYIYIYKSIGWVFLVIIHKFWGFCLNCKCLGFREVGKWELGSNVLSLEK